MAEVTITINGRHYDIACDHGQEGRIIDLAGYIDQQIGQISQTGAAYNDTHLQILTLLVVADQLFEARETGGKSSSKALSKNLPEDIQSDGGATDAQMKKLEESLRSEMQAEYAERLKNLQNQLANANSASDDQDDQAQQDALKIIKHLTDRVGGLAAKVDSL